jgi:hypothetical protein
MLDMVFITMKKDRLNKLNNKKDLFWWKHFVIILDITRNPSIMLDWAVCGLFWWLYTKYISIEWRCIRSLQLDILDWEPNNAWNIEAVYYHMPRPRHVSWRHFQKKLYISRRYDTRLHPMWVWRPLRSEIHLLPIQISQHRK